MVRIYDKKIEYSDKKMAIGHVFISFVRVFIKFRDVIRMVHKKNLYVGPSFYPLKKRKSKVRCFWDQVKHIYRYGSPEYFYFMYGLDVKYGKEYDTYLNYAPFRIRRDYLNCECNAKNSDCCILRNKLYFDLICKAFGFKTVQNVFCYRDDTLFKVIGSSLKPIVFSDLLLEDDSSLFCKAVDGQNGCSAFPLDIRNHRLYFNYEEISVSEFEHRIKGAQLLFQKRIIQHEKMCKLNPSSVNTIRLTTVRNLKSGEIKVWPSALRIGLEGSNVDNLSQGGIIVGIDLVSGCLNSEGFQRPEFGGKFDKHPTSGFVFKDFEIPFFEDAKKEAIRFHSILKGVHSIGWDVAITPEGPVFVEGNDNWEIEISQAANRGLAKEFEEDFF